MNLIFSIIERALGVSGQDRFQRGSLNADYQDGIRTSYGVNQHTAALNNYDPSFNTNRGVVQEPTQFKRENVFGTHGNYQRQPQFQGPPPQQQMMHQPGFYPIQMHMHPSHQGVNAYHQQVPPPVQGVSVRPYNPNDFQGGFNNFNAGFMQMPPYNANQNLNNNRTNRFAGPPPNLNQPNNLQNMNNPYDVAFNVKRHRPQAVKYLDNFFLNFSKHLMKSMAEMSRNNSTNNTLLLI